MWRNPEHVFGTVLLRMGLLWSANNYPSDLDCAKLRAMTDHEGESADMLFVIFSQFLILYGAILNFACFPKAVPLD